LAAVSEGNAVRYVSTRGRAPSLDFEGVLLAGLASDGGLYVPEQWPTLDAAAWRALVGKPYPELATQVMLPFVGDAFPEREFAQIVHDAYAGFDHTAVAPLRQTGPRDWLLELFHGPTLAFKDYALQLLGRLFDRVLERRAERITIVGATSGDTGSAAIEACRDKPSMRVFILHPKDRVSPVQRRQMTTVASENIHNIAIEGTFDDCQALLKAMFNDARLREKLKLSAINSINWARVMAQIVYYAHAALSLGAPERRIGFVVPTGNFGNVFAGYGARAMGLPIERLVAATNSNDIVARFFSTGEYRTGAVQATLSPSMDIQVSSNFERLLFDLLGRDGSVVERAMSGLGQSGGFSVAAEQHARAREVFDGHATSEESTLAHIAVAWREMGVLVDPHTAVGLDGAAAARRTVDVPLVTLAPAHPAKFPDAVERATGQRPALPPRLADLMHRPERLTVLPNDLQAVSAFVEARA
jgi:threonine synthase